MGFKSKMKPIKGSKFETQTNERFEYLAQCISRLNQAVNFYVKNTEFLHAEVENLKQEIEKLKQEKDSGIILPEKKIIIPK